MARAPEISGSYDISGGRESADQIQKSISVSNRNFFGISETEESSSPGEFHPQALTDPDVTVSRHPALIIQLPSPATLPYPLVPPISG